LPLEPLKLPAKSGQATLIPELHPATPVFFLGDQFLLAESSNSTYVSTVVNSPTKSYVARFQYFCCLFSLDPPAGEADAGEEKQKLKIYLHSSPENLPPKINIIYNHIFI